MKLSCSRLLVWLALTLVLTPCVQAGEFEKTFRAKVSAFLISLDAGQRQRCLHDVDDDRRWRMHYPGGRRPGIQIRELSQTQRGLMMQALAQVLSPYGIKMARAIAAQDAVAGQDALGKYWVTCFGNPSDGSFAFRLAEHHLTFVHLEFAEGEAREFGPILLGANPPSLWKDDEQALLDAWKLIDDDSVLIKGKKGIASMPMPHDVGVLYADLNKEAQQSLRNIWEKRLSIFTPAIRDRVNQLHEQRGGWGESRIAFYNEKPAKRCIDGGRWDFKCGLPGMVWDFEGSRGHIHMSLWVKDAGE
ncbi:MAG: DUF3500 domain-containing protein [Akkermansiaceae bacterium]